MITEEMIPAMQGGVPSVIATVNQEGMPNVSYISQVFFVDEHHVAVSNQFFNKTMKNIQLNGTATVNIVRPDTGQSWYLWLKHSETRTQGPLFDEMSMQLDVIASLTGMTGIFKLAAAEIFKVTKIEDTIIH